MRNYLTAIGLLIVAYAGIPGHAAGQCADYATALKITMAYEGGYVRATRAKGGEIYRGITRVSHPKWEGWAIADKHKLKRGDTLAALDSLVPAFYKEYYWDVVRAGELNDQHTANDFFNNAVRMGTERAIKMAQRKLKLPPTGIITDTVIALLNRKKH
ncbi:MAG: glycosyl hydrolase 108 family protein [Bacteroidota bacterium]